MGASLLSFQLLPLGMMGKATPKIPNPIGVQLKPTPILFIHGVFHNRATFAYLTQRLNWQGFKRIKEVNFLTGLRSIQSMAEQTAFHVRQLQNEFQINEIDIIAHSMGGLVARQYIQSLGGDGRVRNLITLGTPHQGTNLSRVFPLKHLRELSPKSHFISKLNAQPIPKTTQVLSISGELDFMIHPQEHAQWPGVRNICLPGVGHAGLLFSKRVFGLIQSRLSQD